MKATIVVKGEVREVSLYKLPLDRLKKSPASKARWIELLVNGVKEEVKVTDNKKWAGNADWIEYPWIRLNDAAYWFALRPLEKAESVESVVTAEGSGAKFTVRVTSRIDVEAERIVLQRKTWYDRRSMTYPDDLKAELVRRGMIETEVVAEVPEVKKSKKKQEA